MTTNMQINTTGLLLPGGVDRYSRDFKAKLFKNTKTAMQKVGKEYKMKMQNDAKLRLKVKRASFVKSISYKVYFRNTNRVPTLHYYSRIPWMGIHSKGGIINKRVVIPLSSKKIGRKTFKDLLETLKQANNLFFEKRGNKTFLWSKNLPQFSSMLATFKKSQRIRTNSSIKSGQKVYVGIIERTVRIIKRIKFEELARESISVTCREIERLFATTT